MMRRTKAEKSYSLCAFLSSSSLSSRAQNFKRGGEKELLSFYGFVPSILMRAGTCDSLK